MARRLRLYSNPITGRVKSKTAVEQAQDSNLSVASKDSSFIKYIPRNVSPISHVIIPQTSGLDPNAHLTPLKGYQIKFKGKILEKHCEATHSNSGQGIRGNPITDRIITRKDIL